MERYDCFCLRCNWVWYAKVMNPMFCARCKSPLWNSPRVRSPYNYKKKTTVVKTDTNN